MKRFSKKQKQFGWLVAIVTFVVLFTTTNPLAIGDQVTTFESPDIKITAVWTPYHTLSGLRDTSVTFDLDHIADTPLFDKFPDYHVEVAQPQDVECIDQSFWGSLFSNTCLSKEPEPDVSRERRVGDDSIVPIRYTYRFHIFYSATTNEFLEEFDDVDDFTNWLMIDYKGQNVEFKHLSVKGLKKCTVGSCDEIAITPVDGTSFAVSDFGGVPFSSFSTVVSKLPANTDASHVVELELESDYVLDNFYFESDNPPTNEDALDDWRQEGVGEDTSRLITLILIAVAILAVIFGIMYVLLFVVVLFK